MCVLLLILLHVLLQMILFRLQVLVLIGKRCDIINDMMDGWMDDK
jgi:hypothetical protein